MLYADVPQSAPQRAQCEVALARLLIIIRRHPFETWTSPASSIRHAV